MKLFPAIDLYEGKCGRLQRGDYDKMTVYSDDPVETALGFAAAGAEYLHVVDLQGARSGGTPSFPRTSSGPKWSSFMVSQTVTPSPTSWQRSLSPETRTTAKPSSRAFWQRVAMRSSAS